MRRDAAGEEAMMQFERYFSGVIQSGRGPRVTVPTRAEALRDYDARVRQVHQVTVGRFVS